MIVGTFTTPAAAQNNQAPSAEAPNEQTKNAVELAIEESKKRGESVVIGCLQDCDESSERLSSDRAVAAHVIELPKPAYTPLARAAHVSGVVNVMVLVDFDGKVIAAVTLDGHPLLRAACVSAARGARFAPTLLEGQPVKVTGVIRYTFSQ
jgi:TonB family protein